MYHNLYHGMAIGPSLECVQCDGGFKKTVIVAMLTLWLG